MWWSELYSAAQCSRGLMTVFADNPIWAAMFSRAQCLLALKCPIWANTFWNRRCLLSPIWATMFSSPLFPNPSQSSWIAPSAISPLENAPLALDPDAPKSNVRLPRPALLLRPARVKPAHRLWCSARRKRLLRTVCVPSWPPWVTVCLARVCKRAE